MSQPALDFSPDRPIESREADLLDRKGFADQVATAIRGWSGRDSLVLALCGEWGSGKSSLRHMIVESLAFDSATSPIIVEFNPWQWAGQEQLANAFFSEIGKGLGRKQGSEQAKASAKRWRKYGALLGLGAEIFAGTRRLALASLLAIAALSIAGAFFEITAVRVGLGVIAFLSLLGFALLQTSDRFAKGVATYFLTVAEVETKSLDEVKAELSNSLRSLARPMLVVIDDVDRLTGPETRLLFQLIKANADFPNMIYLVLFQREAVEAVLTRELSADGRGYLKKIVQVAFDVPNLQRSKLEAILFSKLDALLRGEAILKLWDQDRWTEVFIPGIGPYFMTLRDVYRFVSMLSLQFAVFSRKDAFEVNPIDLIALEVLRVFEPEVYKALSASKETLTKTEGFRSSPTREDAAEKEEIHGIIKKATEGRQESVKEILTQVFPPASWALNGSRDSSDRADAWYREHRACHPHVFDKYFQLSISEDDLSHEEIERIIALAGDRQTIVNQLRAIGKRNLLGVAMDRLDSYKETISLDHAVPFLTGIFDIGDELPVGQGGMTSIAPDMHAARIVYWYLKREPSVKKRQAILGECIAQTTGIYLSAFVVALEGDKAKEKREQESRLADDAGVKHLQDLCVSKIRDAAMIGTLAEHPRLGQLLGLWQAWASLDEVRNWVRSLVETPGGLLSFLVVCLRETKSYGLSRYRARSYWDIDLDAIEKLVPLELIELKLAELTGETLEGKARQAVDAFHEALKRKREGKPKRSIIDFE